MKPNRILPLIFISLIILSACKKDEQPTCKSSIDDLKMNQIQMIGSHNSYRLVTSPSIYDILLLFAAALPANANPLELDYTHVPLPEQFNDYGVRSIELDIYHDPQGGHFYERTGNELAGDSAASNVPELLEPGFKIIHIPDIDYNTNYFTLKSALTTVKDWSDAHPDHLPITIYVEIKTSTIYGQTSIHHWTEPITFDEGAADDLDAEIDEVFGASSKQIITPDDIRGSFSSLETAVLENGWPTIAAARGKVLFVLSDGTGAYKAGHPSLTGRRCFVFSEVGTPECAFVIENNPIGNDDIPILVQNGYMVRTLADAGTHEARDGDHSRKEAAFASGAQIISTDYYKADYRADTSSVWSNYAVVFPGREVARNNPVNGSLEAGCSDWE